MCALAPSSENCYLAYPLPKKAPRTHHGPPSHAPPGSSYIPPTNGEVLIFDAMKLEAINVVEAHRSPLSCIAISSEGTILATASDKGTIIRVFSIPQAEKLYQFRRGSIPSSIYNMSFNLNSTLLCVSSASETVHIFRLGHPSEKDNSNTDIRKWLGGIGSTERQRDTTDSEASTSPGGRQARTQNGTFGSIIRRSSQTIGKTFASSVGGYLPSVVTEMWEPARDFAHIKLPKETSTNSPGGGGGGPVKSVVAMRSSGPQIMVVTSEGFFYVFNIDMEKGGEGILEERQS